MWVQGAAGPWPVIAVAVVVFAVFGIAYRVAVWLDERDRRR